MYINNSLQGLCQNMFRESDPTGLEFDHIVPVELFNNSDHQWDKSLSNYQEVKD